MKDDYGLFLVRVGDLAQTSGQRYGQALFNLLHEQQPHIAEQIQATELDPFYKDSVHQINPKLWEFIANNWQ